MARPDVGHHSIIPYGFFSFIAVSIRFVDF
jgi:hypothetical protein